MASQRTRNHVARSHGNRFVTVATFALFLWAAWEILTGANYGPELPPRFAYLPLGYLVAVVVASHAWSRVQPSAFEEPEQRRRWIREYAGLFCTFGFLFWIGFGGLGELYFTSPETVEIYNRRSFVSSTSGSGAHFVVAMRFLGSLAFLAGIALSLIPWRARGEEPQH